MQCFVFQNNILFPDLMCMWKIEKKHKKESKYHLHPTNQE